MRQGSNPKRLRGRTGRKNSHPRSQTFESNGPEVKVRGNAQQVVEKYLALARDASSVGDRITAESYFQHAEHYYRVMTANGGGEDRNAQGHRQNPQFEAKADSNGAAPRQQAAEASNGSAADAEQSPQNGLSPQASPEPPPQEPQSRE